MSAWAAGRADRVEGRPLSPRAFRHFGIEAVVLGPPASQEGLVRRDGIAIWRRLEAHAPVFDRVAEQVGGAPDDLMAVRVVVAATPGRDRAMRVPALGERAARVQAAAVGPPPATGWLLLVDEGPGETWLYLAEDADPERAVRGFIGRRGRTDFARARRRTRWVGWGGLAVVAGFGLGVSAPAFGHRAFGPGQAAGAGLVGLGLWLLASARPR